MCLPLHCGRTRVRWAAVFWSWVRPQSCQTVKSLLWNRGNSFQRNKLCATSVKTKTHFSDLYGLKLLDYTVSCLCRCLLYLVLVSEGHVALSLKMWRGRCTTYKGLLWAATANTNGARFFQQVEVFSLELESFHTALQANHRGQLWPVGTHIFQI